MGHGMRRIASLPRRWWAAAGVVLVTLLAVVGSYVEAHPAHFYAGLHLTRHPPLVAYLVVGLPAVALIWRNRWPVTVFFLTVAGAVAWAAFGQIDGAALVPVIVALYWLALTRPRHVALTAGISGAAAIFLAEGLFGPFGWLGGPNATMWPELLAAGAVGGYVAARRQWQAAERDRAERAQQVREDETRRRVDAERMRIARELHDVVAHSMAMINVQATAAALQLADDPARVSEALQAIRSASKSGLRELRAILEVLRQVDEGSRTVPVPDLRGIQTLVDATSAAGTPTTLRADGDVTSLPAPVALAAYRIVQESLTNVVRHAGPAPATVTLVREDGHLIVDVVNEGSAAHVPFGDGAGTGLAGMRERATALGGTLEAGARPGGGFGVHAKLPATVGGTAGEAAATVEPTAAGVTLALEEAAMAGGEEAEASPSAPGQKPDAFAETHGQPRVSRP
jgi:signal transduction histidine kinase